jgi:hypothetical protein
MAVVGLGLELPVFGRERQSKHQHGECKKTKEPGNFLKLPQSK